MIIWLAKVTVPTDRQGGPAPVRVVFLGRSLREGFLKIGWFGERLG